MCRDGLLLIEGLSRQEQITFLSPFSRSEMMMLMLDLLARATFTPEGSEAILSRREYSIFCLMLIGIFWFFVISPRSNILRNFSKDRVIFGGVLGLLHMASFSL